MCMPDESRRRISHLVAFLTCAMISLSGCAGPDSQGAETNANRDGISEENSQLTMDEGTVDRQGEDAIEITPTSATGCTGTTCIYVNGSGLRVNYATVTNRRGNPVGRAMISSNWDGRTHVGPVLRKGQAWRFDYNRIMNNGNKVCGSIEGIDVACVTISR